MILKNVYIDLLINDVLGYKVRTCYCFDRYSHSKRQVFIHCRKSMQTENSTRFIQKQAYLNKEQYEF